MTSHIRTMFLRGSSIMTIDHIRVLALGSGANGAIGALTGLLGGIILRHEPCLTQTIMFIGILAGGLGGLLHALFALGDSKGGGGPKCNDLDCDGNSFGRVCVRVFSKAPCWSAIGASISFWLLEDFADGIAFTTVLVTALAGTMVLAIYAMGMAWLSGSYGHLAILENQVLVLAQKLGLSTCSQYPVTEDKRPIHGQLVPEFEYPPTKRKTTVIEID